MWGKDQKPVGTSVQNEVSHNGIQHFFEFVDVAQQRNGPRNCRYHIDLYWRLEIGKRCNVTQSTDLTHMALDYSESV